MAGVLTHRWDHVLWGRVATILRNPPVVDRSEAFAAKKHPGQRQRRLTTAQMDEAIKDYQSGLSSIAVGRKYGINPSTVLNNLRARGIAARSVATPSSNYKARAIGRCAASSA